MKKHHLIATVGFLSLFFVTVLPAHAQTYAIADLGTLTGYSNFTPKAINASGQVVGSLYGENGDIEQGGLFSSGILTAIAPLPEGDPSSYAWDINDAGVITAVAVSAEYGSERYFTIAPGGSIVDLGISDSGGHGYRVLINNAGQIAYTSGGIANLRTGSTSQPLGALPGQSTSRAVALNDAGMVAGISGSHAFLYDGVGMTDLGVLPGDVSSTAYGINASGAVVGISIGNGGSRPFLYSGGMLTSLGFENVNGVDRTASAVNASGLIVGDFYDSNTDIGYATLYSGGIEINLDTRVDLVTLGGGVAGFTHLIAATAINDAGLIVGYGSWTDGISGDQKSRGFILTPIAVPEPSTTGLCVAGLIGMAIWLRRPGAWANAANLKHRKSRLRHRYGLQRLILIRYAFAMEASATGNRDQLHHRLGGCISQAADRERFESYWED